MSIFTITIQEMLECGYQLSLYKYPIFDESYRDTLNKKIIRHFYFREIGFETPDKFNFYLENKMEEIMPIFNKMYKANEIEFNPLEINYEAEESEDNGIESNLETESEITSEINSSRIKKISSFLKNYTESGNRNIEISEKRTENGEESITKDWKSEKQNNLGRTLTGTLSGESKRNTNNNLLQENTGTVDFTSNISNNESKSQYFSDTPQTNIDENQIMNWNFLTTATKDSQNGNSDKTDKTTNNLSVKNTGTVDESSNYSENANNKEVENSKENESRNESENSNKSLITNSSGNTSESQGKNIIEKNDNSESTEEIKKISKIIKREKAAKRGKSSTRKKISAGRKGQNPGEILKKYRESLVDIDKMVISSLEDLFMGVYL